LDRGDGLENTDDGCRAKLTRCLDDRRVNEEVLEDGCVERSSCVEELLSLRACDRLETLFFNLKSGEDRKSEFYSSGLLYLPGEAKGDEEREVGRFGLCELEEEESDGFIELLGR
jgi:hypothetical protein